MWLNFKNSEYDIELFESIGKELIMNNLRSNFNNYLGVL